ncbi:MAG: hypothetical protein ACOZCF_07985 [Bacillota bacterium]
MGSNPIIGSIISPQTTAGKAVIVIYAQYRGNRWNRETHRARKVDIEPKTQANARICHLLRERLTKSQMPGGIPGEIVADGKG